MISRGTIKKSFISALYVAVYVAIVAFIMNNAENLFSDEMKYLSAITFLLLLVLSAAIVGSAIFLKPMMMYLDGAKKEGLLFLTATIGWLVIITAILIVTLTLI